MNFVPSMSQEYASSESGSIRRSVRSTAGNRLRELIRLELKKKQNERYLQDTFEGLQSCGGKEGVAVLISENNTFPDDESEYSTEESSEDIVDSDFIDDVSGEDNTSEQENEQEPEMKKKRMSTRLLKRSKSAPSKPTATSLSPNEVKDKILRKSKSKENSKEKSELTPTEGLKYVLLFV